MEQYREETLPKHKVHAESTNTQISTTAQPVLFAKRRAESGWIKPGRFEANRVNRKNDLRNSESKVRHFEKLKAEHKGHLGHFAAKNKLPTARMMGHLRHSGEPKLRHSPFVIEAFEDFKNGTNGTFP